MDTFKTKIAKNNCTKLGVGREGVKKWKSRPLDQTQLNFVYIISGLPEVYKCKKLTALQKLVFALIDILTKQLYLEKHNFFDAHFLGFFVDRNVMVSTNFFNQNNFSRFWDNIFQKNDTKKNTFPCTITILDHTLYGKVKKYIFF